MSFTPGAGTRFLLFGSQPLSGGTISGNSSASFLDISGTWNTTGTPTGIKLNVTDTASNANSLLMDLQTGGTSLFRVTKDGLLRLPFGTGTPNTGGSPGIQLLSGANVWGAIFAHNGGSSGGGICLSPYGSLGTFLNVGANQVSIGPSMPFGWAGSSGNVQVGLALALFNESGVLAQRNGVNAQTLRVYNTFTDASNYERAVVSWASNILTVGTENAGTGLARDFVLQAGNRLYLRAGGVTSWEVNASNGHILAVADNSYDIGAATTNRPRNVFWAGYQQMSEMTAPAAPAANSVRIYAEDNGSGKTRLMALFATGAAQQIAIEP